MVDDMQRLALASRLAVPILYGTDAVHGHNNVFGTTVFPHNVSLGASRDAELVRKIGEATALEVRATGIHWVAAATNGSRRCYQGQAALLPMAVSVATMGGQGCYGGDGPDFVAYSFSDLLPTLFLFLLHLF